MNAYKTLIIAIYALPALLIFAWMGEEVCWGDRHDHRRRRRPGRLACHQLTLSRRGELWIKIAVVVMVGVTAAKLWV